MEKSDFPPGLVTTVIVRLLGTLAPRVDECGRDGEAASHHDCSKCFKSCLVTISLASKNRCSPRLEIPIGGKFYLRSISQRLQNSFWCVKGRLGIFYRSTIAQTVLGSASSARCIEWQDSVWTIEYDSNLCRRTVAQLSRVWGATVVWLLLFLYGS